MSNNNDPQQPDDDSDPIDKIFGRVSNMWDKVSKIDPSRKPDAVDRFFRAVKSGKMDDVRAALEEGFDPNIHNKNGDTPLHICARENLTDMADLLMSHKANPRLGKKDEPKQLPLDDAVNFGKAEMTELLARYGGYLPGNTVNGWSLLHRACEKGKPQLVAALLKAGANGNELTQNGATPLLVSVMRSQNAVADMLLDFPDVIGGMNHITVSTDEKKRNAFQLAVERGQTQIVRKMIERGTLTNIEDADGLSPLQHAIRRGDSALIALLIGAGADTNRPNAHGSALVYALRSPEIRDETQRAAIVGILIAHGADADIADSASGETPLMIAAASYDKLPSLQALIAHGASLDLADKDGKTAVFHATGKTTDALKALLEAGAAPDARHMQDAATPLIAAARADDPYAVQVLLAHGANPWLYDSKNKSALSYALDNVVNEYAGAANATTIARLIEEKLAPQMKARRRPKPRGGEWDL